MRKERLSKENLLSNAVRTVRDNAASQLELEYANVLSFHPDVSNVSINFGRFRPRELAKVQEKARRAQTERAVCGFERAVRISDAARRADVSSKNSDPEYLDKLAFTVNDDEANVVVLNDKVAIINDVVVREGDESTLRATFDPFRQAVMSSYKNLKDERTSATVSEIISENP